VGLGPDDLPDEGRLLRRIHPELVKYDEGGSFRVTSAAFKDEKMSVDIGSYMPRHGLTWKHTLQGHPDHLLVSITAGTARELQQSIEHCAIEDNPVHAQIEGHKTTKIARCFAKSASWIKGSCAVV